MFATERPANIETWKEEESVTFADLVDCLAFLPSQHAVLVPGPNVGFLLAEPKRYLGEDEVCCTPCFKIKAIIDTKDAGALGEYFLRSRKAMAAI